MRLLNLFSKAALQGVLCEHPKNSDAAQAFTDICGKSVSPQLVSYWRKLYEEDTKAANRTNQVLKQQVSYIKPTQEDDIGDLSFVPDVAKRILVVPDIHAPYTHKLYLPFLKSLQEQYQPDLVICLGDEVDGHALSFHDSDPNLDAAGPELHLARCTLGNLHSIFPRMLLCDSNHGSLIYRKAKAHGIPIQYIKRYRDILFPQHGAKQWSWRSAWVINTERGPVLFKHQSSGPALSDASHEGYNVVVGHEHGKFQVQYAASRQRLYYAALAGCGIDADSLAFAYGKLHKHKPILGCLVILDGVPKLVPMPMPKVAPDSNESYAYLASTEFKGV